MAATKIQAAGDGSPSSPKTTLVEDVIYRADGVPATGWVVITWPAFNTADGAAVAAGSMSVKLGNDGSFSAELAPNNGAVPAGTYYAVTLKLDGGVTSKETWLVPATSPATLALVRATVAPATMAMQALTADWANANLVNLTGAQTIPGVKTFASSPAVPDPIYATDAANKEYVDANSAGAGSNGASTNVANTWTQNQTFSSVVRTDLKQFSITAFGAVSGQDATTAIHAALAAITSAGGGTLQIPPGVWKYQCPLAVPNVPIRIEGAGTVRYQENSNYGSTFDPNSTTIVCVLNANGSNAGSHGLYLNGSGRNSKSYFYMRGVKWAGLTSEGRGTTSPFANGIDVENFPGRYWTMEDVQETSFAGYGVYVHNSYVGTMSRIFAKNNGLDGFALDSANEWWLNQVQALYNGGAGLHILNGNINFVSGDFSANNDASVKIDTGQFNRISGYAEAETVPPQSYVVANLGVDTYYNDLDIWASDAHSAVIDLGVANSYPKSQATKGSWYAFSFANILTNSSFDTPPAFAAIKCSASQVLNDGVAQNTSAKCVFTGTPGDTMILSYGSLLNLNTNDVVLVRAMVKANRPIYPTPTGSPTGFKLSFVDTGGGALPADYVFPYLDTTWREVGMVFRVKAPQPGANLLFQVIGAQADDTLWLTDLMVVVNPPHTGVNPYALPYVKSGLTPATFSPITAQQTRTFVQSVDPFCAQAADTGKLWFDTTTSSTAMKVCMSSSGSMGWVSK